IRAGGTVVLVTASIDESVPPWKAREENPTGWLTAEYSMLPGSTAPRKHRDRGKVDGRSTEIQRLIGRSLRAAVDFQALGGRTVTVDCDVLQADGGTRTLSITGGFIAVADALAPLRDVLPGGSNVLTRSIAAVSTGVVDGTPLLDLDYSEDSRAEVDLNVVMTGKADLIEVQGTAEGRPFSRQSLNAQLDLADLGIARLTEIQQQAIGADWPDLF
ncbi:MAG: ribonuclease PH, partial [Planctomycetaceae bacterium]|nr:ribonuclease PH [Planctomycetaceae bacterium]